MKIKSTLSPHIINIQNLAIETFASKSEADKWLHTIHPILGATPIAISETPSGLIEVKKILNAISYGGVV